MTGGTSAARAAESVMRVLLDAGGMGTVLRVGAVAGQAHRISQLAQHRLVLRAVWIVATETRDAARVHEALNEIVALHAVLMRTAVGKVREACFTELVLFKLPKICKVQSDVEADGPIVVLPFDRIVRRTALRMTLDANVVGMHIVEVRGIEDVVARRVGYMSAPSAMAPLAADIPFADRFGRDIVVHRMAAIAKRAGRTLEVVSGVKRRSPIGVVRHKIAPPLFVRYVPLRGLRKIIVADLGEITLLPAATVDESDVVFGKADERIGLRQIRDDGVRMLARIAHHIRHPRLAPAGVDILVAFLASRRA